MNADLSFLSQFLIGISPLVKEELEDFHKYLNVKDYEAQSKIIEYEQRCRDVYFVLEGFLKYTVKVNGKDRVVHIASKGDIVTDFFSYLTGQLSISNLITINNCRLASVSRMDMERLFQKYKGWERFGRIVAEQGLVRQILDKIKFQTMTAEEIYLDFIKQKPHIFQQVKLGDLAQTFGISQETLSRIRRRLAER